MEKKIYWCEKCSIPIITDFCYNCKTKSSYVIGKNLKPVFRKEFERYKKYASRSGNIRINRFPNILFKKSNRIISDASKGNTHFILTIKPFRIFIDDIKEQEDDPFFLKNKNQFKEAGFFELIIKDKINKRSEINEFYLDNSEYMDKLIKGNLEPLREIEKEAIEFIQRMDKKYKNYKKICSFSGGKDSSVTAYLVKKALGNIPVVFSDTGIEYPDTIKFVKEHGSDFGELIYLPSQNDFLKLCEQLGIPSRIMRWCCSTQKAAPIHNYYRKIGNNILSFDGIRKVESNLRANYPREKDNTKFIKQFSVYPILEWNELEVWLYIFWQKIPYNPLYEEGFSRIGCWGCPNNGLSDVFLFGEVYPEMAKKWFRIINDYRLQQNKKILSETDEKNRKTRYDYSWLEEGAWKGRRVKYHDQVLNELEISKTFTGFDDEIEENNEINEENFIGLSSPCGKHDFTLRLNQNLNRRILEFFKVFGKIQEIKIGERLFYQIKGKD
ncbi:MAG: phosphoadenosine phosphosulfate reductase domain-containing protein, partial [Candidatus Helarchaeota archaeon]